jgi:hypothetical protein
MRTKELVEHHGEEAEFWGLQVRERSRIAEISRVHCIFSANHLGLVVLDEGAMCSHVRQKYCGSLKIYGVCASIIMSVA